MFLEVRLSIPNLLLHKFPDIYFKLRSRYQGEYEIISPVLTDRKQEKNIMSMIIADKEEFQSIVIDSLKYYAHMNRRAIDGSNGSLTLYRSTGMWTQNHRIDLNSIKKFDPKLHDLIAKVDGDIAELDKYVIRPV